MPPPVDAYRDGDEGAKVTGTVQKAPLTPCTVPGGKGG